MIKIKKYIVIRAVTITMQVTFIILHQRVLMANEIRCFKSLAASA